MATRMHHKKPSDFAQKNEEKLTNTKFIKKYGILSPHINDLFENVYRAKTRDKAYMSASSILQILKDLPTENEHHTLQNQHLHLKSFCEVLITILENNPRFKIPTPSTPTSLSQES